MRSEKATGNSPSPLSLSVNFQFHLLCRTEKSRKATKGLVEAKMSISVRCRLVDFLYELTEEEFKRFKMHLEDYPLEEGYKAIPHCQAEMAGPIDIAQLMVSAYEEAKALQMTVNIFDRINKKDLLAKVRHEMPARFFQPAKPVTLTKEEERKQQERIKSNICDRLQGTQKKVEVTLDPKTAYPTLVLSEDLKSVHLGQRAKSLPDSPERFNFSPCVLGAESISSGTAEWVVEVGKAKGWAIGVVRESIERKWHLYVTVNQGFWVLRLTAGEYEASTTPSTTLPLWKSPRRIKVRLEYDFGILSFYDADSMESIFSFNYPFSERLFPFFQVWDTEIPLKICPSDS